MDQSNKYLNMCKKAEEIQCTYIPSLGDRVHIKWKDNSSTGGLNCATIQDRPAYGVSYNFAWEKDNRKEKWYIYNGGVGSQLIQHPDFEKVIWLPRQDQLSDMMVKNIKNEYLKDFGFDEIMVMGGDRFYEVMSVLNFCVFVNDENYLKNCPHDIVNCPTNEFDSWEQIWLAFVMKIIYGKVWIYNKENTEDGEWIQGDK
jgi:hypothetical protein